MAPPLEDSLAGVSCLEGVPVSPRRWYTGVAPQALQEAVLCAIQDISLRVEQGMCPGDAFGEGWVCHCLVGKRGFVD